MIDDDLKTRLQKRVDAPQRRSQLSPAQVASLLERAAYGEPYEQIAAAFGCSLSTVRNHVKRALKDG